MIAVPILVIFVGYTGASYGVILMKSWNITFKSWINPLNPYQWPANGGNPDTTPPGQLFPGGTAGAGANAPAPAGSTAGSNESTLETFLQGLEQGGLLTPSQIKKILSGTVGKLFGF